MPFVLEETAWLVLYLLLEREQKDKWKKGRAYSEINSYEEKPMFYHRKEKIKN